MNAELIKRATEKVGNPNILINLISRRVRQLNAGGAGSRPLISETVGMGAADVALTELIEEKLGWNMLEPESPKAEAPVKKRRKSSS